jgi:uncharacterized protein YndB with AHSA1/START domain
MDPSQARARAEVIEASPGGFTVKMTVEIAAPPAAVYSAVVRGIGSWWDAAHTWSGDPRNLSIDGRAGGLRVDPGKMLRLSGGLGPLQDLLVTGVLTMTMEAATAGTRFELTCAVGGYARGGLADLAAPVDRVLAGQAAQLKQFAENGKP